ncbi:MAG TPA: crosslink repair DNA glycosylase YcaQ family protein, partial [Anaerolineales bacterium]|nr:crosslink repair DNA glycosylase YcaQ family protein [Anaerolineales bacterium]
ILPVGVAQAGAWKYSHIYTITTSHFPELAERARTITESQARAKLLELYFEMVGAAQIRDVQKLFGWGNEVVKRVVGKLVDAGGLVLAEHPKQTGEWVAVKEAI